MGGDDAPRHVVDGALAARAHFDLGVALVGAARGDRRASSRATPDVDRRARARRRRARRRRRWTSRRRRRCGASRGASIRVAAEIGGARRGGGAVQRRPHRRDGDGGARARSACCRASIGRRWRRRFRRARRPAVLLDVGASVECRPQHLLQFAVMGSVYARVALGIDAPRVGLLSIGEEATKGNELTREAHRLLKASPLPFIGNVEARDVYSGARRRDRLRRLHRQRRAEDQRRAGRDGRGAAERGVVEHDHDARRIAADAARVAAFPPARRLLRVRRRAAARRRRRRHRRPRPVERARPCATPSRMAYRFAADRFIERVEQDIAAAAVSHQ